MKNKKSIIAIIISVIALISVAAIICVSLSDNYGFSVDASQQSEELPNVVSNINIWDMSSSNQFTDLKINEEHNIGEFVEYVQLMQCTGGNTDRDLFVDPLDFDTLDDYDFSPLIENCKGILKLGAKPHLKLGSVPLKYSSAAQEDTYFGTNVYPPDDYDVYYDYMLAMAKALVSEFGKEEVLSWRFGVMTEYENKDWFYAKDETPESSAEAYCKLYDYTVDALQTAIGKEVFVGAHSMTVTEGLWDENIFIEHCAKGTNFKTGKTGTRICFLSASFYDLAPGEFTSGKTLPETIAYLQECAKNAGLENLIFGIDEGRLLYGNTSGADDRQLLTRTVGYTYQAAYDARLYKQLFDIGGNYFSAWSYLSNGFFDGNPTVSYHVATNVAKFAENNKLKTKNSGGFLLNTDVDTIAAFDEKADTLRIMTYNFKNDVEYSKSVELSYNLNVPQFDGKEVTITAYVIGDDCNYFDEWVKDRETYGIGDDCFGWSPEDPQIEGYTTLKDEAAREIYFNELREKYAECSRLEPVITTYTVENSTIEIKTELAANNVVFYEITAK